MFGEIWPPSVDTKFLTSRSLESLRVKGRGPVGLNENIRIYKYLGAFVMLKGWGVLWNACKESQEPRSH